MISILRTMAVLITLSAFTACAGNKDNDYVDKSIMPTEAESAAKQADSNATVIQNSNALPVNMPSAAAPNIPGITSPVNLSQTPQAMNVQQMAPNVTSAPIVTPAGMNPPHGEPGHRCDISVGAPLNSKPANPTAAAVSQQPNVTMTEVPNKTVTAPGMNPPHGEPNHRCDIAVGAPLNSKPANAVQPVTVNTTPPALLTPPKTDSTKD